METNTDDEIIEGVVWDCSGLGIGGRAEVISRETAQQLVDGKRYFWDGKRDVLIWRGPASELKKT